MSDRYDVLIIGAGMVGASLALALARGNPRLNVGLLESADLNLAAERPRSPSYDARVTAVSEGSRRLLAGLGVWPRLEAEAAAIKRVQVSDAGQPGWLTLDARDLSLPALGQVVTNGALGQALVQALRETSVDLQTRVTPLGADFAAGEVVVRGVDEGDRPCIWRAAQLVLADGGRSALGRRLHLERREQPYGQMAVIASLSLDSRLEAVAQERFTPEGPIALLPQPGETAGSRRAALVWTLPADQAEELGECDEDRFVALLQRRLGFRSGRILRATDRHAYPLSLSFAREQVRRRLAVVGNAAQTLHPVAGQGFNLSLRGALVLADELLAAARRDEPLGELPALVAFHKAHARDRERLMGATDALVRVFSRRHPLVAAGRSLGLAGLALCPPLRRELSRAFTGLDQPLPRFMLELAS